MKAVEDCIPADIRRELTQSDRKAYLEQRLFVWSPLGTFGTALCVFIILGGSYTAAALLSGGALIVRSGHEWVLFHPARSALLLSLLIATVLGIQRYARIHERADFMAFASVLKGGVNDAGRIAGLTPDHTGLVRSNIIGLAVGLVLFWTSVLPVAPPAQTVATYLWFAPITVLTALLFARGVSLTRAGARSMRETIDNRLIIDLLRIDRLSVIGRSAARGALIWFVISAVVCLFFIGADIDAVTIALLFGCAAMGVWIFIATMERVHRKIRAAKAAELEHLRSEIDGLRPRATADAGVAQCLQGLLAYETRIAAAPEWPFDQTTLVRVLASVFILAVPWFGQAIAAFAVERFADIAK